MMVFRELGISKHRYIEILEKANGNKKDSISQNELGSYLMKAVESESLTEPQAEAIWNSMGWDKSFNEGMRAAKRTAVAMEQLRETGISQKDYERFLSEADNNGDESVSQKEMYAYLKKSSFSQDVKEAIWESRGWTKSMEDTAREVLTLDMKGAAFAGDAAAFKEALSEYTKMGKAKDAYSSVKSFVRKVYMGGDLSEGEYAIVGDTDITDEQARRMLRYFADMSVNDAVETVSRWKTEREFVLAHGDEYEQYGLTVAQAQFYYNTAKGKVRLESYAAQVDNYGMDRVKAFYKTNGWAQTGLTIEQYDNYATAAAMCKGTDKDGDGMTDAYSVMYQKFAIIDAMPVSYAIKDEICRKEGWAERNIAKAPWHR